MTVCGRAHVLSARMTNLALVDHVNEAPELLVCRQPLPRRRRRHVQQLGNAGGPCHDVRSHVEKLHFLLVAQPVLDHDEALAIPERGRHDGQVAGDRIGRMQMRIDRPLHELALPDRAEGRHRCGGEQLFGEEVANETDGPMCLFGRRLRAHVVLIVVVQRRYEHAGQESGTSLSSTPPPVQSAALALPRVLLSQAFGDALRVFRRHTSRRRGSWCRERDRSSTHRTPIACWTLLETMKIAIEHRQADEERW